MAYISGRHHTGISELISGMHYYVDESIHRSYAIVVFVRLSVCLSVRLSVCLSARYLENRLTDLDQIWYASSLGQGKDPY